MPREYVLGPTLRGTAAWSPAILILPFTIRCGQLEHPALIQ
jgi:hypothetical protein